MICLKASSSSRLTELASSSCCSKWLDSKKRRERFSYYLYKNKCLKSRLKTTKFFKKKIRYSEFGIMLTNTTHHSNSQPPNLSSLWRLWLANASVKTRKIYVQKCLTYLWDSAFRTNKKLTKRTKSIKQTRATLSSTVGCQFIVRWFCF